MKTNAHYTCLLMLAATLFLSCIKDSISDSSPYTGSDDVKAVTMQAAAPCAFPDGIVANFNPNTGEIPEGIAVDNLGKMFASLAPLGLVVKVECDGSYAPLANIGPTPLDPSEGIFGLVTDDKGRVYAAVHAPGKDYNGVFRIDPTGETAPVRLPGSQNIFFPNSLTFDARGNLYVTSSLDPFNNGRGSIWRIPPEGEAALWITDTSLTGSENPFVPPIGANGIAHRNGMLYVANSTKYLVIKVPILPDGSAGQPEVLVNLFDPANPLAGAPDGIAVDARGNVYVPATGVSQLLKISPDGGLVSVLADFTDKLTNPGSLAFGKTFGEQTSIFITNFTADDLPKPEAPTGPAIVKIDVGIPGKPKS